MIFLSDIKGTITAVVPSPIYQGSSDADEFVLIAPFPRQSVVCVAITLPNGQIIAPRISTDPDTPFGDHAFALELLESFSDKLYNAENIGYNAWRIKVNAPLTQYGGNLSLQFLIATGDGVIKTTSSLNVNIGRGTPYIMPQDPEGWNQVLDLLSTCNTLLLNLRDDVAVHEIRIEDLRNRLNNVEGEIADLDDMKTDIVLLKEFGVEVSETLDRYNGEIEDLKNKVGDIDPVVIKGRGDDSVKQSKTGAKALGDRCAAFNASVAGCLGYRYKAIDLIDKKIYLTANNEITGTEIQVREISTEILDNVIEDITLSYAVGDKFTLKMRSYDLDNVGTITAINGNEITYDNTFAAALSKVASQADLEGSSLKAEIQKADTYIDRYSFSVPLKADKGELVVSEDAVSFGTSGNIATGRHSISAGRDNLSVGDFSTTFGRGCEAWYGSLAVGYYMKALGDRCAAVGGAGVTVRGDHGFGTGNTVTVEENALCGFGAGMFNSVTNPFETVFGRASASKSGSIFRIGNGALSYSEGSPNGIVSRSNAFVVFEDGHAEIYVDPVNTDSLVRLGYLPFRKATYSNSLCSNTSGAEATQTNSIAWGIDAKAKGSPSFSLGESCVVDEGAHYGLGIGRGVHIKSYATQGIGFFLDTFSRESGNDNCFQFIVGAFNAPLPGAKNTSSNEGARFIVGNGTGTNHRSNGFVSWGDGRATIGADPTNSMDVVPKHMYDELLARVVALEQAIN